jgi:hypothetical protein
MNADELFNQYVSLSIDLIIKGVEKIDESSVEGQEKLKNINQHIKELDGITTLKDEKEEKKRRKEEYDAFWIRTYGYSPKTLSNEEFDKKYPNTDVDFLLKGLKLPSASDLKTIVKNSRK